jgi:hypothetical protein
MLRANRINPHGRVSEKGAFISRAKHQPGTTENDCFDSLIGRAILVQPPGFDSKTCPDHQARSSGTERPRGRCTASLVGSRTRQGSAGDETASAGRLVAAAQRIGFIALPQACVPGETRPCPEYRPAGYRHCARQGRSCSGSTGSARMPARLPLSAETQSAHNSRPDWLQVPQRGAGRNLDRSRRGRRSRRSRGGCSLHRRYRP